MNVASSRSSGDHAPTWGSRSPRPTAPILAVLLFNGLLPATPKYSSNHTDVVNFFPLVEINDFTYWVFLDLSLLNSGEIHS